MQTVYKIRHKLTGQLKKGRYGGWDEHGRHWRTLGAARSECNSYRRYDHMHNCDVSNWEIVEYQLVEARTLPATTPGKK